MAVANPTVYTPATGRAGAGGSNLLQFLLTAAQHQSWLDYTGQTGTGAAGAYQFFSALRGGSIGEEFDSETLFLEDGSKLAELVSRQEVVIARTEAAGLDKVVRLSLKWLENNPVPARDALPENADGTYAVNGSGNLEGTVLGFHEVSARKTNRQVALQNGQLRSIDFELVATLKTGETEIMVVENGVDLEDETGEPWLSTLAPFTTPA